MGQPRGTWGWGPDSSFIPPSPVPTRSGVGDRVPREDGVRVHPPWCWGTRGRPVPSCPLTSRFCPLPQRRQEEGYYSRLEAERRRQHDEAERQLLEPEELGLGQPPLPRGYEPSAPAPPPPPQRTASYLQAQVLSPDALYTAKLVAYTEEDDDEDGGPAGQDAPPAPGPPRAAAPACGGVFLSSPPPAPATKPSFCRLSGCPSAPLGSRRPPWSGALSAPPQREGRRSCSGAGTLRAPAVISALETVPFPQSAGSGSPPPSP